MDANPQLETARTEHVSLVISADRASTEKQIRHSIRMLASGNCHAEVLLVDPNAFDGVPSAKIPLKAQPQVVASLIDAVKTARHETILVVDPKVMIESHDLCWISERRSESSVQCYFKKNRSETFLSRVLLATYQLISWLLLGIKKTRHDAGIVVVSQKLAGHLSELSSNDCGKHSLGSTGLLAIAKHKQIPIEEIAFEQATSQWNKETPNWRTIVRSAGQTMRFWWNQIMFPVPVQSDPGLQSDVKTRWVIAAGVAVMLATFGMLITNLDYPLFEPDEARNAQLAINIIESGDWLSLTLAEEPYWDKPPLQMWAIATSYKIFGISPLTTRLPGVLASALTVLFTLVIGRRLVGFRAALLGSLLLLLSCGFLIIGRYVTMDASLNCCVTLMALSLFAATRSRFTKPYLLLAGLAAGVGLLIKGPVILVVGLPPVLAAMWLSGNRNLLRPKSWLLFFVPAFLIASPWFLATAIVNPDFLIYFFWKHHVVRFSDAFNHRQPFWFYLPTILVMMFPASYLFPSLVNFVASRKDANRNLRTATHGSLLLMSVWIVGFFSMAESKLPTYILPALPPLCLLMGVVLDKKIFSTVSSGWKSIREAGNVRQPFLERVPKRNLRDLVFLSLAILLVCRLFLGADHLNWWLLTGVSLPLVAICVSASRSNTRPAIQWYAAGITSFCFVIVSVNQLTPQIAHLRSNHAAAKLLKTEPDLQNAPVVFFGRENYGAAMTLPKDQVYFYESEKADEVCEFLIEHPNSIIISSKKPMKNLRRMLSWNILLDRSESARHLYQSRLNPDRELIADKPSDKILR